MDEAMSDDGFTGDQGRRDALKKLGVGAAGAAAVWSAPSILSVTAAAAATIIPPLGCPGCGLENVLNGSFENPVTSGGVLVPPTDWSINGLLFAYADYTGITPPPVPAGAQTGLTFTGSGEMTQQFTVSPACVGRLYSFQFWAYAYQGTGTATLRFVGSDGSNDVTINLPGQFAAPVTMSLFTNSAAIPTGTTAVQVGFEAGVNQVGVDLVSFIIGC